MVETKAVFYHDPARQLSGPAHVPITGPTSEDLASVFSLRFERPRDARSPLGPKSGTRPRSKICFLAGALLSIAGGGFELPLAGPIANEGDFIPRKEEICPGHGYWEFAYIGIDIGI